MYMYIRPLIDRTPWNNVTLTNVHTMYMYIVMYMCITCTCIHVTHSCTCNIKLLALFESNLRDSPVVLKTNETCTAVVYMFKLHIYMYVYIYVYIQYTNVHVQCTCLPVFPLLVNTSFHPLVYQMDCYSESIVSISLEIFSILKQRSTAH